MADLADKGTGKNGDKETPVINLEGLGAKEKRPDLAVTAWDRSGECLHSAKVAKDGSFSFPRKVLRKAHRVRIGPEGSGIELLEQVALTYRPDDFQKLLDVGTINVGRTIWDNWFILLRCVTGRVRVCRPGPWWYADLTDFAILPRVTQRRRLSPSITARSLGHSTAASTSFQQATAFVSSSRISPAASLDHLIAWPMRCAPVCQGTIEVFRRTCCCEPWIVHDPRFDELIRDLEDIVRVAPEPIPLPDPPGPTPDPAPFAHQVYFKDGTLDEMAVRAAQDLKALRSLPVREAAEYINARPYLFCRHYSCSAPVKVAEGQLGPEGRFNICWIDFPRILKFRCHDEYSYVVKQPLGQFTITIYNGVAANRWHQAGDDPTLTSYHPWAYGCRDNPGGAHVYLDLIGDTGAHHLHTPDADGADSVETPGYNHGLVFPAPSSAAALGANLNRNWGGTLKLSYLFSEGLQDAGAKFYRISVIEANAAGDPDPAATRYYLDAGLSWNKSVPDGGGGVDIVPVSLGPTSAGGENFLFLIPYDTNPVTDWNAGQYHAHLNTNDARWSDPTKRHLVMLEIFDENGQRLRPTGTPATGLGGAEVTAAFKYRRRYQETGDTDEVPFGALTHMFWWDNREIVSDGPGILNAAADIVDLRKNGIAFNDECLFFSGAANTTFSVGYRAYHENEMFQLRHEITWKRGLGNTAFSTGTLQPSISTNVGQPPNSPGGSATNTFHEMLRPDLDPTRTKCAFTAFLSIWNKRTDGDDLGNRHSGDTAAFVIEIAS